MSPEVSWFIKGRVILIRFHGNVTMNDVKMINRELVRFFHRAEASQIHILIDTTHIGRFSRNLHQIREIATAHKYTQMGWLISFGSSPSMIEYLVPQLLGLRYRRVQSMEHALYFLRQVDSSFVEIPPD